MLTLHHSCAPPPFAKNSGANANARNRDMRTPLHWAASNGNASVVRALVAAGADMEAKNADGETPLEVANYWNNPETAPALRHLMVSARDCVSLERCLPVHRLHGMSLAFTAALCRVMGGASASSAKASTWACKSTTVCREWG
jgi:hypothetical protein